jgi:hypothetical protein
MLMTEITVENRGQSGEDVIGRGFHEYFPGHETTSFTIESSLASDAVITINAASPRLTAVAGETVDVDDEDEYEAAIEGGALTVVQPGIYCVTPEGDAPDDLVTINGGLVGDEIKIHPVDSANPITVKHGLDNIQIGADFTLDSEHDILRLLKKPGGIWVGGGINDNA